MAKPAVYIKRNHLQTVCTSKDKAQRRNTSRLEENKIYYYKSRAGREKHKYLLVKYNAVVEKSTLFFKSNQGDIRVWRNAVLRYFWRGFVKIFILSCGIAVFKDQVVFFF